ncbi:MAG: hypothetical protein PHY73_07600 [Candidatus Omnitrophica bacterium]|nr:hypothetical protein [Candidatus Omnitrophota bacterium]
MKNKILFVILCFTFIGCARLMEIPKSILGSSTKALEDYRSTATVKQYPCSLDSCFNDILDIADEAELDIFIKEKKRGLIVLMGFEGVTDTTEVGIFLTSVSEAQTKLEVVSLSSSAQRIASELIFLELNNKFLEKE